MVGAFARYEPSYTSMLIPTFPIKPNKTPAVRGWRKAGLKSSPRYAAQFPDADAFGFECGPKSGITAIDVDSTDENLVADMQSRHGDSKVIVRTASGKFHLFYGWNWERRAIRPWGKELPVDVLGENGYVVAAKSILSGKGEYEIIVGNLEDLKGDTLTKITSLDDKCYANRAQEKSVPEVDTPPASDIGKRNTELFNHMQHFSRSAESLEDMMREAARYNDKFSPPLPASEVAEVAANAWWYEENGLNRVGRFGAYFPTSSIDEMSGPDVAYLLMWLRGHNAPDDTFWVADGLAEKLKMGWRRFAAARKEAIATGWIVPVSKKAPGRPVSYQWGPAAKRRW